MGIGDHQQVDGQPSEAYFTPEQILNYQSLINKKNYMQDPEYLLFFFKSMSSDGKIVTVEDMRRVL